MGEDQTGYPQSMDDVIERYGDWTASSIYLGNGEYTLDPPRSDRRMRRFIQVVADLSLKPIDQLRVLDLACLEGHYAIEFAKHGAEVVGIEGREANIEKGCYVKRRLGLTSLELYQDDVRNLSVEKYGNFDAVLCAGILYHLPMPDVIEFVKSIYDVSKRLVIFDTHFSLRDRVSVSYDDRQYWGLRYHEHDETDSAKQKAQRLWSSLDNATSIWFTHVSLCNLMAHVGFTSFYDCLNPSLPENHDRKTYIAIKGQTVRVLTSPPTDEEVELDWPEHRPWQINPVNRRQNYLRTFFKAILPQGLKNAIKPTLRAVRLIEPNTTTPEWYKKLQEKKK